MNALSQMNRIMEAPACWEDFDVVLSMSNFASPKEALLALTSEPKLLKFLGTPHLLKLGAQTDDDIVLPGFDKLNGMSTVEEKIDGAMIDFPRFPWSDSMPKSEPLHLF